MFYVFSCLFNKIFGVNIWCFYLLATEGFLKGPLGVFLLVCHLGRGRKDLIRVQLADDNCWTLGVVEVYFSQGAIPTTPT